MDKNLLEYIFLFADDDDIINLSLTCKKFKEIINRTFWMNKIIHKYPILNYQLSKVDYKMYYNSLKKVFKETNLHYISAICQYYGESDILLILSSIENFQHSVFYTVYYENRKNIHYKFYLNPYNNLEGRYIEYYKNGNIKEISYYRNNEKHGICILKNQDNSIEEYGNYKNNLRDGFFRYFNNGIIDIECEYVEGMLNGRFKSYIEGEIFEDTNYINNYQDGKYSQYNSKGKIKREGYYNNGKREGTWKYYDDDGILTNEEEYSEDIFCYL